MRPFTSNLLTPTTPGAILKSLALSLRPRTLPAPGPAYKETDMPISKIQIATIYVSDQDAAIDFYVNKLGFEQHADQAFGTPDMDGGIPPYRWVEVAPPGAATSLVLAKGYGGWTAEHVGKFAGIVFETEDVQVTYEELVGKGVEFTEPPTMQPWGMMQAQFVDQDGNGLVLVGH